MQMGIILKSEVSNEGIVKVLQHVQQYLPKDGEGENITTVEKDWRGDQLTIEQAVNTFKSMVNDTHQRDLFQVSSVRKTHNFVLAINYVLPFFVFDFGFRCRWV